MNKRIGLCKGLDWVVATEKNSPAVTRIFTDDPLGNLNIYMFPLEVKMKTLKKNITIFSAHHWENKHIFSLLQFELLIEWIPDKQTELITRGSYMTPCVFFFMFSFQGARLRLQRTRSSRMLILDVTEIQCSAFMDSCKRAKQTWDLVFCSVECYEINCPPPLIT